MVLYKHRINEHLISKILNKEIAFFAHHFYYNRFSGRCEIWSNKLNLLVDKSFWIVFEDNDESTDNDVSYDCFSCYESPYPTNNSGEKCETTALEEYPLQEFQFQKVSSLSVYSIEEKWHNEMNDEWETIDADICVLVFLEEKNILMGSIYNRTQELFISTDDAQIEEYIKNKKLRVTISNNNISNVNS